MSTESNNISSELRSLLKTAYSKNVTVDDWNKLITIIGNLDTASVEDLTFLLHIGAGTGENSVQQTQSSKNISYANDYYSFEEIPTPGAIGKDSFEANGNSAALGELSFASGRGTATIAARSHTEGTNTIANGINSHAEGGGTYTGAEDAHAEGMYTKATGRAAHSEGHTTFAEDYASHAEGDESRALAYASHAEGFKTRAYGNGSHAEGNSTDAGYTDRLINRGTVYANEVHGVPSIPSDPSAPSNPTYGRYTHAEGAHTYAKGPYSHAEGAYTVANGEGSHAGGYLTETNGNFTFAHGKYLTTNSDFQSVFGKFNNPNSNNLFSIGNGTSPDNLANAFTVFNDGHAEIQAVGTSSNSIVTKSITDQKISKTDIPSGAITAGVRVLQNGSNGVDTTGDGTLRVVAAVESEIAARSTNRKPITPANLNTAVKAAFTDSNKITFSDTEKAAIRTALGMDTYIHKIVGSIRINASISGDLYGTIVILNKSSLPLTSGLVISPNYDNIISFNLQTDGGDGGYFLNTLPSKANLMGATYAVTDSVTKL